MGSAGTALWTSCPGSFLCSWTVHRARSVCKRQSSVRATCAQARPDSPLGPSSWSWRALGDRGHGRSYGVQGRLQIWCPHAPPRCGYQEASAGSLYPFSPSPPKVPWGGGDRRGGTLGEGRSALLWAHPLTLSVPSSREPFEGSSELSPKPGTRTF